MEVKLAFGRLGAKHSLRGRFLMPEDEVIFSDGMDEDGLEFRSGLEATVGVATGHGHLLV